MNGQSDCHKIHENLGALTDRRVRKRGSTVFIEMDKARHSVRISLSLSTYRKTAKHLLPKTVPRRKLNKDRLGFQRKKVRNIMPFVSSRGVIGECTKI